MATATCAPELFVSVIGTFLTESDLGVGTVVGSAIYNTLGVSACAGLAARKAINLEKWPLLRDSGVYIVTIVVLAIIVVDDLVMWYEALFMLFMYFGYFLLMFTQGKLKTAAKKLKNKNSFRSCKCALIRRSACFATHFTVLFIRLYLYVFRSRPPKAIII